MIDLSNINQYISYFENLATTNKQIAHTPERKSFFVIEDLDSYEEVLSSLKSLAKFPALVIEYPNVGLGDESESDNLQMQYLGAFLIILKKAVNQKNERELVNTSLSIAKQVYLKMRKDRMQGHLLFFSGALGNGNKVDIGKDYIGYRFTIKIHATLNQSYNPADWL